MNTTTPPPQSKVLTITGLLLALVPPCLPLSRWENEFAGVSHLVGYEVIWWALIAAVLLFVHFAERRPLSSIGFRRPTVAGMLIAVAAAAVMIAGLAAIYLRILPALHITEDSQLHELAAAPRWWLIISLVRAAAGEEILFRGYAIERFRELTGSLPIAAIVSWAVFTAAHVPLWGWGHLLVAGFCGAILTLLYLWRRNLWVTMLAHFLVDATGLLLS